MFYVPELLTPAEAEALQAAVEDVQKLVPGLVVWGGPTSSLEEAEAILKSGHTVWVGHPKRYDVRDAAELQAHDGTLASTYLTTRPGTACLNGIPVVIYADLTTLPGNGVKGVVYHEFMHSLGFGHAERMAGIKTLMRPMYRAETSGDGFSKADQRSIVAVYARGFF